MKSHFEEAQIPDAPTYSELLDALVEMVGLHCTAWKGLDDSTLDSFAISSNAEAMRLLSRAGKLVITTDRGRRVIGRFTT
jgi:hypothetical protein